MKRVFLCIVTLCITLTCGSQGKKPKAEEEVVDKTVYAEKVKAEFLRTWHAYKRYAWGHDDLKPLSKQPHDWYSVPLLKTPVDAFSTMKIMELEKEAEEAKNLILEKLSFDLDKEVILFETNIRLLGGLLSSYQLDGDQRFIELAVDLANRLIPAFDSPTGMPYRLINLKTGKTKDPVSNPAEIGTLFLEWGTLSKITGNPIYYQKAKAAVQALYDRRSELDLVGEKINVETGEWVGTVSHISSRIDSYYEYLLKGWLMFGDQDMKKMWDVSIQAVNKHLVHEAGSGLWYCWVDMNTGKRINTYFGALDAFFPAVLALSGDLERAKELQKSCYKMWALHGIEPEILDYATMETVSNAYMLRPEIIESTYYLYHYTKNPGYLREGKQYFEDLVKYCRNDVAYASLKDVRTKEKMDVMESFFLAETLKYLYLLFAPQETVDFNKVIFNTEAHPLKIWPEPDNQ